ncbi:hypothetical protein ACVNNN_19865 [Lysinibacillus fusiformis]|uniref:hypothetical protein n=1 Tax=Lysinibacillus sp. PWR01 TaxID=3342384 RepID=UPI00372D30BD
MFKSKAIKINGLRKIDNLDISDQMVEIENQIINSISKLLNKHSEYKKTNDGVKVGDLVNLKLKSTNTKFNKENLPVVVGTGLFDKGFEELLINFIPTKKYMINFNGDEIEVTITEIKRKILPELTNDLIKLECIDKVVTVEDYKTNLFYTMVNEKAFEVASEFLSKVREESEFIISENDVNLLFEGDLSKMRFLSLEEGMVLEEMTDNEIGQRIGMPSLEKFEEVYKNERYPIMLKRALIGFFLASEDNFNLDESTYEQSFEFKDYYKNYSMSDRKKLLPFFNYLVYSYSAFAQEKITNLVKESFSYRNILK